MTKTEKYLLCGAFILMAFWGCNRNNKAAKYHSKYLENDYILERLKTNHPETYKMIKEAKEDYINIQVDAVDDNRQTGLDN